MERTAREYLILAAEVLGVEGDEKDLAKDPEAHYLARAIEIAGDRLGYNDEEIFGGNFGLIVKATIDEFKGISDAVLKNDLREALRKFVAAGGRGPGLADAVDMFSIINAIRQKQGDWPGPREWRPKKTR